MFLITKLKRSKENYITLENTFFVTRNILGGFQDPKNIAFQQCSKLQIIILFHHLQ